MAICSALSTGTATDLTEVLQQGRPDPLISYHYPKRIGSCPKLGLCRGDITELID